MQTLLANMRTLCDEMHTLTGLSVAYGTSAQCETALYGRAQEVTLEDGRFVACERPLKEDSLFDLASLSKLMTAAAIMILVRQGKLSLLEYAGQIDKRFADLKDVSVFDILSFRASLQTPGRLDETESREESLRRLFAVKRCELPAVRVYSDINAMVLKYIVESKTGLPFAQALNSLLFEPAGMKDTFAIVPESELSRCVCYNYEHRIQQDTYILRSDTPLGAPHDPKSLMLSMGGADLCGHAGLFSSRKDMIRFAQALLRGELLCREDLLSIAANYTGRNNGDGTWRQYLGFQCFTKHPYQHLSEVPEWMQERSIGLSGFTGNHLSIDPIKERFVLFLGNRCHNRVSNIVPPKGETFSRYQIAEDGVGNIAWPDGRLVASSAKYVYFKDKMLHAPIYERMKHLGWC
ncbi:MAG: beta-lactamase family protein [Clostridia bacterium]|nr:beta-lactamase family protein [Clostridia bacterium]